ncbi:MAG: hypothetical protein ACKVZJ_12720 [Phycisphaerales bacterium]
MPKSTDPFLDPVVEEVRRWRKALQQRTGGLEGMIRRLSAMGAPAESLPGKPRARAAPAKSRHRKAA